MRPDVFVVWAHTSPCWDAARTQAWRDTVRHFAALLNDLGANAKSDLDRERKLTNWSKYCLQRLEDADRIVVAVSPGWKLAFSSRYPQSRGAEFECRYLRDLLLYEPEVFDSKVIPVVLPGATEDDIPIPMKSMHWFVVDPSVPESALELKHLLGVRPEVPQAVTELLNTTVYLPDPGQPGLYATEVDGHEQSVLVFTDLARLVEYRRRKGLPWEDRWLEVDGATLLPLVRPLEVGVVVDAGAPAGETVFVSSADIRVLTG